MRIRLGVVALVLLVPLAWRVPAARGAAEVHRFNLVLSGVPTQIRASDVNSVIDHVNQTQLLPRGLEPLGKFRMAWLFNAELRYFVRQNLAVSVGVGQIRSSKSQEYLPAIARSITISAEVTSVPVHTGAAFYFRPYTQGDFQARAYAGAGFTSIVHNRASLRQPDNSGLITDRAIRWTGTNDAPGYYGEVGAHLFFASRFSVLLSGLYRSGEIHNLVNEETGELIRDAQGRPVSLDVGGTGVRMGLAVGL